MKEADYRITDTPAVYPTLQFGDGFTARIRHGPQEVTDEKGMKYYYVVLEPYEDCIEFYNLNENTYYPKKIPKLYMVPLNHDARAGRWFCFKTWKLDKSPAEDHFGDILKSSEEKDMMIAFLEMKILKLKEYMSNEDSGANNPIKEQAFNDIQNAIKKGIVKVKDDDDK